MFKLLKIFLLIALIGGLSYYGYPIIKHRYFNSGKTTPEIQPPRDNAQPEPASSKNVTEQNENTPESTNLEESLSGENSTESTPTSSININERNTSAGKATAHITTEHCDTDCRAFANDFRLLEYCQQVCGIIPIKKVSNCGDKSSLEKDYCLKDLAVTEKDSSQCEKIKDANIKLTCRNRIIQDILEGQ